MQNVWQQEHMTHCPEPFSRINQDTWIQRVEIIQNGDEGWTCKSRFIGNDEYQQLVSDALSPAQLQLLSAIQAASEQNLVTMEALAELYEQVSNLTSGG